MRANTDDGRLNARAYVPGLNSLFTSGLLWVRRTPTRSAPTLTVRKAVLALLAAIVSVTACADGPEMPEELVSLIARRKMLQTGRVAYRVTDDSLKMAFTQQFAGATAYIEYLGDNDGILHGHPRVDIGEGEPDEEWHHATLVTPSQVWQYGNSGPLIAQVRERTDANDGGIPSMRSLGLASGLSNTDVEDTICDLASCDVLRYATKRRAGMFVIIAEGHEWSTEWELDPERDFEPARVRRIENGELRAESRIELDLFDSVWFPRRVETETHYSDSGRTLRTVLEVQSAEFNRPAHPGTIGPSTIGVVVGTNLHWTAADDVTRDIRMWDGKRVVSQEEFSDALKSGAIHYSPRGKSAILRASDRARDPENRKRTLESIQRTRPAWESAWESYTRQFIARFRLTDEQSATARRILRSCQDQAHEYMNRHQAEFAAIQNEQADIALQGPRMSPDQIRVLSEKLRRLNEPIDRMYQEHLVPRLDQLPTRDQRRAAASAPAIGS